MVTPHYHHQHHRYHCSGNHHHHHGATHQLLSRISRASSLIVSPSFGQLLQPGSLLLFESISINRRFLVLMLVTNVTGIGLFILTCLNLTLRGRKSWARRIWASWRWSHRGRLAQRSAAKKTFVWSSISIIRIFPKCPKNLASWTWLQKGFSFHFIFKEIKRYLLKIQKLYKTFACVLYLQCTGLALLASALSPCFKEEKSFPPKGT